MKVTRVSGASDREIGWIATRKGFSRIAMALVIVLLLIAAFVAYLTIIRPIITPAQLSFSIDLPKAISAGQSVTTDVVVSNDGGDAKEVTVVVASDAIESVSGRENVKEGSQVKISLVITGEDVQDGPHDVEVYLQYSDGLGSHTTASKHSPIYLIPNAELVDVRFEFDIFQPFGKSNLGKTDSTSLLFKTHSKSSRVVYTGIWSKLSLSIAVPGISVNPSSIQIEPIGPNGMTGDYRFSIITDNAPSGTYSLTIALYSKDNQLIAQQTVQLTVSA